MCKITSTYQLFNVFLNVVLEIDILKQKPKDHELKVYAVSLMNATKTFEYCRHQLTLYEERAREEVRRLGGNARLEKIIDRLSIPDPASTDAEKDVVPMFVTTSTAGGAAK